MQDAVLVALLVVILGYGAYFRQRSLARGRLFPGPPSLPLLCNVLQLPPKRLWVKLAEMSKTYGACTSQPGLADRRSKGKREDKHGS